MTYDIAKLEKLSESKIQLMEYSKSHLKDWKNRKTDFLKFSEAPDFIKDILIYKNFKRPHLFFGEAFVAMQLANTTNEGWFNSWDWISSGDWSNGIYRSDDPIIHGFMDQFYEKALCKYVAEKLPTILQVQDRFSIKPEPPDLWLIDKSNEHHFIEVKRGSDKLSDEQLLGLLLIHEFLGFNIHLVWLYEEGTKPPGFNKIAKHIEKLNSLKANLIDSI